MNSGLRDKIKQVVMGVVDETNALLPPDMHVERSSEARLTGPTKQLDSLGLVTFVAAVEQRITERLNVTITLADERSVLRDENPLSTLGTLMDYTTLLVAEKKGE